MLFFVLFLSTSVFTIDLVKKKYIKNSLFILSMVLFEKLYDSMILFGNYTTTDAVPIILL